MQAVQMIPAAAAAVELPLLLFLWRAMCENPLTAPRPLISAPQMAISAPRVPNSAPRLPSTQDFIANKRNILVKL